MDRALRAFLIQSGKKLLEINNPLQKWGLAVAARRGRGEIRRRGRRAQALRDAVACLDGTLNRRVGTGTTLATKLSKFATAIRPAALTAFGCNNKADFVEKKLYVLRSYP